MSEKSCNNCLYQKICLDPGITTEAHPEDWCERWFENKDEWVHLRCEPGTRVYVLFRNKRHSFYAVRGEVYQAVINDRGSFYWVSTSEGDFIFSGKEFGEAVFLTKAEAEETLERMNTKNR